MNSQTNQIYTGLIIGCGSIGKKYLIAMSKRYERILVVDTNQLYVDEINSGANSKIKAFSSFDTMSKHAFFEPELIVAVISNWGPDHFFTYLDLAKHKVTRIIIEKPIVNSKKLAYEMYMHAKANNIKLIAAMPRRYTEIHRQISSELIKEEIGQPLIVNMYGGAQCIATNGIHWLDLACQMFESFPEFAYARINDSGINPRSKSLGFYEGNATWYFTDSRIFNAVLTNRSYTRSEINITCEYGSIKINNSGVTEFYKIATKLDAINRPPITRVSESEFIKLLPLDTTKDPILEQIRAAEGEITPKYLFEDSISVINAFITAFEASEQNSCLRVNSINEMPSYDREWNFS